jgi:microcystin-dependent protein
MASTHLSKLIFVSVVFFTTHATFGQIGINTVNPDTSAALDIQGTNKGVLFPRTTQLQLSNIFQPATGLTLFQTDFFPGLYYNLGSTTTPNWLSVGMYHNGNDLFWDKGNVGVGLPSPLVALHIKSNNALLRLEAGVGERAFMEFYADGATTRSGYLGYTINGNSRFTIANDRTNGNIEFLTNGTGQLTTSGSMTIGDDLTVTDQLLVNDDITVTDNITSTSLTTTNATVTNSMTINNDLTVTDVLTVNDDVIVTDHVTAARVTTTGNVNAAGKIQEGSNNLLPAGVIVMWSGTAAPAGWALCDGSGGRPDLRGRFIVGYNSSDADYNQMGDNGGAKTVALTTAQLPSHLHSSGSLITSSNGSHSHTTPLPSGSGAGGNFNLAASTTLITQDIRSTSSGDHTHTISGNTASTGSGNAHENRPPYYTLAYIIKL